MIADRGVAGGRHGRPDRRNLVVGRGEMGRQRLRESNDLRPDFLVAWAGEKHPFEERANSVRLALGEGINSRRQPSLDISRNRRDDR